MENQREELIRSYFALGLSHKDIVAALAEQGIFLSERHLRRILSDLNLYRRRYSDLEETIQFIARELNGSGGLHGYRWMHTKLKANSINARREEVREIIKLLDPDGVENRRSRRLRRREYVSPGPDYIWHIDGQDKIKRYGFAIHGCIDGFSRKLIWLNVYSTNNDPRVIAGYFWEAVKERGGCPLILRADAGTENGKAFEMQSHFREEDSSEAPAFIQGPSTANQRIESFWCQLRKQCLDFWINLFGEMEANGHFTGDMIDKNIMQFCFMSMIQDELDRMSEVWNDHTIRESRRGLPTGRPNIMYSMPFLYGARSYSKNVNLDLLQSQKHATVFRQSYPCDHDFFTLCVHICQHENHPSYSTTVNEARNLYDFLRQNMRRVLNEM